MAAPPLAPPPRPYSVGRPRAQPALCSAAAGASVCADLEGGSSSSSLLPLGVPSALQPLARRSPSQSRSPSRGPSAAPVSCRECAGARGEAVGRGRPGRVQLRAAARRRGRAPETGELSVRGTAGRGCSLGPSSSGLHPPLFVGLWCRWLTRTRGGHDPTAATRVVELGIGPDTGAPLVSTVTLVPGDPQYLSPGGQPASTPCTRSGPPKSPFTLLGILV